MKISFRKFTLGNGLRFIVHEDRSTPMAVLNVLYDVGARDEDPGKTGFAHLFEHLMFGGSVNIPDFETPLQLAGGRPLREREQRLLVLDDGGAGERPHLRIRQIPAREGLPDGGELGQSASHTHVLPSRAGARAERGHEPHGTRHPDRRSAPHAQRGDRLAHIVQGAEVALLEPLREERLVDDAHPVPSGGPADSLDDRHGGKLTRATT